MLKHKDLTDKILKSYYEVYNELGYGFLEKVYQNSLFIVLAEEGFKVVAQQPIHVYFRGKMVGEYFADLIVNDLVILELKATPVLLEEHEWQLSNYLKASNIEVGLLLNFGQVPTFKRKIYFNDKKNIGT
jgi:GxxExxY protein